MQEDSCELVVGRRGKALKKLVLNEKASNMLKEIFPCLLFTFGLLVAQPKTHTVLPKVGFQHSAVWGEIQTINSFKLSSSTLRYLPKKAGWPWRTFRPHQWWSDLMKIDPEAE